MGFSLLGLVCKAHLRRQTPLMISEFDKASFPLERTGRGILYNITLYITLTTNPKRCCECIFSYVYVSINVLVSFIGILVT